MSHPRVPLYSSLITFHSSLGLGQLPQQHFQAITEFAIHAKGRGRLIAAMDHAMLAARVLAIAIFVPRCVVHQTAEGCVMLVGDQIARSFPATDVASGVAPSRARQLALAAQEFQVDWR